MSTSTFALRSSWSVGRIGGVHLHMHYTGGSSRLRLASPLVHLLREVCVRTQYGPGRKPAEACYPAGVCVVVEKLLKDEQVPLLIRNDD